MAADITGTAPDGSFLVTHTDTGITAPATLEQLKPYPDLYAKAIALSAPVSPGLQQYDNQGNPFTPPPPAPEVTKPEVIRAQYDNQGKVIAPGTDAGMGAVGQNPDGSYIQAPLKPAVAAPAPAGSPAASPADMPPPAAPGASPAGPTGSPIPAPRGTGASSATAAPGAPDALDLANKQKLGGEAQLEANERASRESAVAQQQAMIQAETQRQAKIASDTQDAMTQQIQAQKEALAAHTLDPGKWWTDKSTIGKILFSLANIVHGAAVGAGGHPENAGSLVNEQIKQNLDGQMERAKALDRNAEAKGNLVQFYRQKGLDDQSAFRAAFATQQEMVKFDLEGAALKLNDKGLSPALVSMAGDLGAQSVKEHTELAHTRAQTVEALSSANASNATAAKTRVETAKLGQNTNADHIAKAMAAAGQPIPKALALLTSSEVQKNITGDGQLLTSDASEANKVTANSAPHLATLKNAMRIVNDPKASALSKKQAAQDAYASAKVYMGLKRGGGEDEQAMASMAPGLKEALGADINWASPGASARAAEALQNEITNVERRSSAEGQAYGRPATRGANIDASPGW